MSTKVNNFIEKYKHLVPQEAIAELSQISMEYEYFEKTFTNSPCTISLVRADGTYIAANKKTLDLMNATLDTLSNRRVGDVTNDDSLLKIIQETANSGVEEKYLVFETKINNDLRRFWISINKVGENFLIIGSDVTDYKNLEEEKQFSNKMAFLGEMSSFIVHEINNPLMSISMANEIIQMNSKDSVIRGHTQGIEEMIETINKIIASLKIFSRKDTNDEDNVDLDLMFEQSLMVLSGKIRNSGVRIFSEGLTGISLPGNKVEFLQVLVNLISNSIDAAKNTTDKWVKVCWENNRFKVVDSGHGIPDHVVPNLFKKFYTSKGSQGNGIGLYLSREILNKWDLDLIYEVDGPNTSFQWISKVAA